MDSEKKDYKQIVTRAPNSDITRVIENKDGVYKESVYCRSKKIDEDEGDIVRLGFKIDESFI